MKNSRLNVERLKFNAYLLMIIATIIFIFIYINLDSEEISYRQAHLLSDNIISQKPINFNQNYDGYLYYAPKHYLETEPSDYTINLAGNDSKFTLHFGNPEKDSEINLDQLNKNLGEPLYQYSESTPEGGNRYFIIWQLEDPEYVQVIIGKDDAYIAGDFKDENKKQYVEEMSYIFNSIKPTEKIIKEQNNDN